MDYDQISLEDARRMLGVEAQLEGEALQQEHPDEPPPRWRQLEPEEHQDVTGEVGGVEDLDPAEPEARRHPGGPIGDMQDSGHGYTVARMGSGKTVGMQPLRTCVVPGCGKPVLNPSPEWVCEFSGEVQKRPAYSGLVGTVGLGITTRKVKCQCNACVWNSDYRTRGRPKEVCSDDCARERQRLERAAERERANGRDRDLALVWLSESSDWSDKGLAEELDIRPARVKEARALL